MYNLGLFFNLSILASDISFTCRLLIGGLVLGIRQLWFRVKNNLVCASLDIEYVCQVLVEITQRVKNKLKGKQRIRDLWRIISL